MPFFVQKGKLVQYCNLGWLQSKWSLLSSHCYQGSSKSPVFQIFQNGIFIFNKYDMKSFILCNDGNVSCSHFRASIKIGTYLNQHLQMFLKTCSDPQIYQNHSPCVWHRWQGAFYPVFILTLYSCHDITMVIVIDEMEYLCDQIVQ